VHDGNHGYNRDEPPSADSGTDAREWSTAVVYGSSCAMPAVDCANAVPPRLSTCVLTQRLLLHPQHAVLLPRLRKVRGKPRFLFLVVVLRFKVATPASHSCARAIGPTSCMAVTPHELRRGVLLSILEISKFASVGHVLDACSMLGLQDGEFGHDLQVGGELFVALLTSLAWCSATGVSRRKPWLRRHQLFLYLAGSPLRSLRPSLLRSVTESQPAQLCQPGTFVH
jgi:hypothetical protein